ncbi:hypothetical protein GXM_09665 [Nostoc sphaeroides CCNUC1]|uniref:Uncharacterized protein n=1 Tax=Nostoc sphaeroides CCNUC1 TaxID=2653204 RepID=A0A5P8WHW3_9NOSO|nr:hypothetical protein GXM_09665 [Nostoc sphaeroides CCNUC1]
MDGKFFSFQNSVDMIAPLSSDNRKKPAFHLQDHLEGAGKSSRFAPIRNS